MSQIMYTYPAMLAHAGEMQGHQVLCRPSARVSPVSSPPLPPTGRATPA